MDFKKLFLVSLVIGVLLSLSVVAIDVDLSIDDLDVEFTGECEGDVILLEVSTSEGLLSFVSEQETSSDDFDFEFFAREEGEYSYALSCDEGLETAEFCVGGSCGSGASASAVDGLPVSSDAGSSSSDSASSFSSGSSSSSGGGRDSSFYGGCGDSWSCTSWSACDFSFTQTRSCIDASGCSSLDSKPSEVRDCSECTESWICGSWSECSSGSQTRSCVDERSCGTYGSRPLEIRSCHDETAAVSSNSVRTTPSTPTPIVQQTRETVYIQETTFMDPIFTFLKQYVLMVGLLLIVLVLLIVGIVFLLKYREEHGPAANLDELHSFVQQEVDAGMNRDQIERSLEQSGWTKQEIDSAFGNL